MRILRLGLLLVAAFVSLAAQSKPQVDNNVTLRVAIVGGQHTFHIGETVPLQLNFSTAQEKRYQINMAQYDRSGRMEYEHFSVSPADGAVDPLANRKSGIGGGLTGFKYLSSEPWTIDLNLNEWVRFLRPGEYRLTITSTRVGVKNSSNPRGDSPITVRGNDLTIRIVPASRDWQKETFDGAVAVLGKPKPTNPQEIEKYFREQRDALETLRFLGTPDALRELAKRMRGEDAGGLDYICMLGLIGSPDDKIARDAMEEALADPDHPIDQSFLYALGTLSDSGEDEAASWRQSQQRTVEQLIANLPAKRGKALSVSLGTAVNEVWNGAPVPKQTTDKLVQQLIANFDQLPKEEQNSLLAYRWDKIAGPEMLPILRRYAEAYRNYPIMNESNAYESLELSANALRRWYELDPSGARPAIIKEITRPRPRYDARVLGILPDKTLPEVDAPLAEHLLATEDFDGSAHISSLIARYATDSVLPQVLQVLDPNIGKWACAIQEPLLAYVLRVSPGLARPRIEQAIAARGEGFSACNHELFQAISEIHFDPILEEIAIRSLDDPDPQVAMNAAAMLGKYGSPAAESALWERYVKWTSQWQGREAELNLTIADRVDERTYAVGLGTNLMQALVTGRAWLTDEAKLQRIAQVTKVNRLRQQLEPYMTLWSKQPLVINFDNNPDPLGFESHVAQYEFHSLAQLEDKLSQFPAGASFVVSIPPTESEPNGKSLSGLRSFLKTHGFVLAGVRHAY